MHYLICCEVAMAFQRVSCTLSVFAHLLNILAKENFGIFRERNFIFLTRYLLSPFPKILVDLLPKSTFPEKQEEISNFREPFLQKARMATTIPHCIIKTEH